MNYQKPLSHLLWALAAAIVVEALKLAVIVTIVR